MLQHFDLFELDVLSIADFSWRVILVDRRLLQEHM